MPKRVDILPEVTPNMSPMMRQYIDIKSQHLDSILFFRLGDFYEMFYNDARVASEELDLVLTKRANGEEDKADMCGIPFHSSEGYIARLVKKGYRVAICEQTEDPSKTKKLVKRDVIRVITPGTVTEESMLEAGVNNYLATVFVDGQTAGLCFADVSTGKLHLTELTSKQLESEIINEVTRFSPKEVLFNENAGKFNLLYDLVVKQLQSRIDVIDDELLSDECAELTLKHFRAETFSSLGIDEDSASKKALCSAMGFLFRTQKNDVAAINDIDFYSKNKFMRLDLSTRMNLELTETLRSHDKKGSLLWVLDCTKTPMGKRLIRNWIELPLLSPAEISRRQNAVGELLSKHEVREKLNEALKEIKDLERLMTRVLYGTANAKELNTLAYTLDKMPYIKAAIKNMESSFLQGIYNDIDELFELSDLIKRSIVDEPPITVREGGLIRDGYNEEVDRLRSDMTGGKDIVTELELREQERTGVKKLKIKYNRVFGYYIEIPNSADFTPPPEYVRRQTLSSCERYITDEVKQLESRILGAHDKLIALEYNLFVKVRDEVSKHMGSVKKTADAVAKLDAIWSLASVAYRNGYVCPQISVDGQIDIREGRHPVVELLSDTSFVPNDTILDTKDNRCAIITGPNMAGKSTYMRQTAIITLMAQIGSFVPAKAAKISICDAIFTRVGASDDLASGKSTFMVEMAEVANILKYATKDSLLIIDEIGRGTSTYDGMSIAKAVLEYVADKRKIGAKTLFATHYHELTSLEEELDGVKNYNIAAKKKGDDIIFLRRIVRGGTDDSYGIEVAKLAGVPQKVVNRAKEILKTLESGENVIVKKEYVSDDNTFASTLSNEIVDELKYLDVNTLTPIECMQKLNDFVKRAKEII